jgi:hypothetical protein
MMDYLSIEYDLSKRPLTSYPDQLAKYLFKKFKMSAGDSILEIGAGRCELLQGFKKLGLIVFAIDSALSSQEWAEKAGINFELKSFQPDMSFTPFGKKFDFIISKSFIEHINAPIEYGSKCLEILELNGTSIILTPDFETNYRIFFDDITHIKPFTEKSMRQLFETSGYSNIQVNRFRQLPSIWNNPFINFLAILTSLVAHHRAKNKWLRWSRELMIIGSGTKC